MTPTEKVELNDQYFANLEREVKLRSEESVLHRRVYLEARFLSQAYPDDERLKYLRKLVEESVTAEAATLAQMEKTTALLREVTRTAQEASDVH